MQKKITQMLLVLFLLFLITANPSGTGSAGRDFVGWLASGWDDARDFTASLFSEDGTGSSGDAGDDGTTTVVNIVEPTVVPVPTASGNLDSGTVG